MHPVLIHACSSCTVTCLTTCAVLPMTVRQFACRSLSFFAYNVSIALPLYILLCKATAGCLPAKQYLLKLADEKAEPTRKASV